MSILNLFGYNVTKNPHEKEDVSSTAKEYKVVTTIVIKDQEMISSGRNLYSVTTTFSDKENIKTYIQDEVHVPITVFTDIIDDWKDSFSSRDDIFEIATRNGTAFIPYSSISFIHVQYSKDLEDYLMTLPITE